MRLYVMVMLAMHCLSIITNFRTVYKSFGAPAETGTNEKSSLIACALGAVFVVWTVLILWFV